MKTAINLLYVVIAIVIAGYIFSLNRKYSHSKEEIERLSFIVDSVKAIEAMPADTTILRDTIIFERVVKKTVYKEKPVHTTAQIYTDSIVNDSIRVWIKIKAEDVFDIEWKYEAIKIKVTNTINKPYPVIVTEKVPTKASIRGLYVEGGFFFEGGLIPKAGLKYLNNNNVYGIEVMSINNKFVFGINYSFKLF